MSGNNLAFVCENTNLLINLDFMAKNVNVLNRALDVKKDVDGFYEPGNQSKSKIQAYRKVVKHKWHIDERTFWRYMRLARKHEQTSV